MSKRIMVTEANGEFAVVDEINNQYYQYTTIEAAVAKVRDILKGDEPTITEEDYRWAFGV